MKNRIEDIPMWNDIKTAYIDLRRSGKGRSAAVDELCKEYHDEITIGAEDDGLVFWIALADAQYALKELSDNVAWRADNALAMLEKAVELAPLCIEKRKQWYAEAPMPERKNLRRSRKYRCNWKNGDTFAYKLSGPDAENEGIAGCYALLHKVDEMEFGDGRLFPVVMLSLWRDLPLPSTVEEFQRVPFMRLNCGRLGYPKNIYEYRTELLHSSQKEVERMGYIYLGNFQGVQMPEDELIIKDPGCATMTIPKMFDEHFSIRWKLDRYYANKIANESGDDD